MFRPETCQHSVLPHQPERYSGRDDKLAEYHKRFPRRLSANQVRRPDRRACGFKLRRLISVIVNQERMIFYTSGEAHHWFRLFRFRWNADRVGNADDTVNPADYRRLDHGIIS
jgi:hypothetical protein